MRSAPVPCSSSAGSWPSVKACAKAHGVHRNTIWYHLERYGHLDFIKQRFRSNRPTWGNDIWIRGKHYPSHTAAAEALGVSRAMISKAKRAGRLHTVGLGK
jgi:hypothetical protein